MACEFTSPALTTRDLENSADTAEETAAIVERVLEAIRLGFTVEEIATCRSAKTPENLVTLLKGKRDNMSKADIKAAKHLLCELAKKFQEHGDRKTVEQLVRF